MPLVRLTRLARIAKGGWTGLVVVLAGVISAAAAVADLTLWVSLAAALAAVLGGLRVIQTELLVPMRLESVQRATAWLGTHEGQLASAVHIGARRWVTAAHSVEERNDDVLLSLSGERTPAQVIFIDKKDDLAVLTIDRDWPWRVHLAEADVDAGDTVRIIGWKLGQYGTRDRLSTIDLHIDGVSDDLTVVLAGLVPRGFSGAPVVDLKTGLVIGVVNSLYLSDDGKFDETNAIPIVKLPREFR